MLCIESRLYLGATILTGYCQKVPYRTYVLKALIGTPDVLARLLSGIDASDPVWDRRPDPDRFTLREVLAHLADWEPIWKMRFERMRDENDPFLESIDEGQLVIDHDYAHQDPIETLARYKTGRVQLVELLGSLDDPTWDKSGNREFVGILTVQMLAGLIQSHDGYHLHQVVKWLEA